MPGPMTHAPKRKKAAAVSAAATRAPKPKSNLNTGRRTKGSPTIKREAMHRAKTKASRGQENPVGTAARLIGAGVGQVGKAIANRPKLEVQGPYKSGPIKWPKPYGK